METKLLNRTVLITGASGGIGSEIVRAFAKEGAKIAIHYHRGEKAAHTLATELDLPQSHVFQADLTQENDIARLWKEVESTLGPIQTLIANAGVYESQFIPIQDMSLEQWNQTLTTNLSSVFLCVRECFRSIQKNRIQDPSIVLIGSTAGIFGEAGHSDYAASKSAMIYGFMKSLKNELVQIAPKGRMNAVCPGWTLTPMAKDFASHPEAVVRALQTIPLKKIARPIDVAQAVLFLSSSTLSGHISGQILELAGGMEGRTLFSPDEIDLSQV